MSQDRTLVVHLGKKSTKLRSSHYTISFAKVTSFLSIRKNILSLRKDVDEMNHVIIRLQKDFYS